LETGASLHPQVKKMDWLRKTNDIPMLLLASFRLSVVALTL